LIVQPLEERRPQVVQGVPSHAGHLVFVPLRLETLHVGIEDAKTVSVALFRVTAHQLLSNADAEHGLAQ